MSELPAMATSPRAMRQMPEDTAALVSLMSAVVALVQAAAFAVHENFSVASRPADRADIKRMMSVADRASLAILKPGLLAARPGTQWDEDEESSGVLPEGEWWVCDPVEGAINHVHGIGGAWGVTVALVKDNVAVLAVVHLPMTGETFTAIRGGGAFLNDDKLTVSVKTSIDAALVATGQAVPGECATIRRSIGESITAMLAQALVVRCSVPPTLELLNVAMGKMEAFWQYGQIRAGLMAGALLVEEAGGIISDHEGQPWTLASEAFLASAPGVHAAVAAVLADCAEGLIAASR